MSGEKLSENLYKDYYEFYSDMFSEVLTDSEIGLRAVLDDKTFKFSTPSITEDDVKRFRKNLKR